MIFNSQYCNQLLPRALQFLYQNKHVPYMSKDTTTDRTKPNISIRDINDVKKYKYKDLCRYTQNNIMQLTL